jgi:hypothetical protein
VREQLRFSTEKNVPVRKVARTLYYLLPPFIRRRPCRYSLTYERTFLW